ncbi:AsmA family protein [Photobacterium lipolyticum]|uniref:AsmA family protein n=1 Tax=Photobacterium lipolyticum TaxID=266810 RepID=A0A2T3MTX7_9GAMM|nr:AsmA family protein [Photobacterium lipolyticum]PSW03385.1 AsmA family protein [Photobacterium lipolyticum]
MRTVGKIFATIVVLLLLTSTIMLALLHTQYATAIITRTINTFSDYQLKADNIAYHISDPWHLQLEQPQLNYRQVPVLEADQLQLWLAPQQLFKQGWYFDSVLIEGTERMQPIVLKTLPAIYIARLALNNLNITSPAISLQDARLQIDNWNSQAQPWGQFSGDFQLSASRLSWQNIKLKNVLIDGDHYDQKWKLYGFSFDWQHASLNGQAEYLASDVQPDSLILHQLTLTGLQLQDPTLLEQFKTQLTQLEATDLTLNIKRLDILESSVEVPGHAFNSVNLSLQDWHWPATYWQQQNAHLSLSASSIQWQETVFEEPLVELSFAPQQITIDGLSGKVFDGFIQTDGALTPDLLALNQVTINGIRWLRPEQWRQSAATLNRAFDDISITKLDVGYAQLTDNNPSFPFQLTGLNINGEDLLLKRHGQLGLWQGELSVSAGFASVNRVTMIEPYLMMQSEAGNWQLTQAIVPFKNGLLDATGEVQLDRPGQPWQLFLQADSMPTSTLPYWFQLPLPLSGAMDITLSATGLAQHQTSLAYSLSGELTAGFRQLQSRELTTEQLWQLWSQPGKEQTDIDWQARNSSDNLSNHLSKNVSNSTADASAPVQPFSATPLHITADRGRLVIEPITLSGNGIEANLQGKWDLANSAEQAVKLQAKQGCQQLVREWEGDQRRLSLSSCNGNNR